MSEAKIIVNKKIDDLIFAEYNPRQLSKEQFKYLKDSLSRFGVVDPIIINKNSSRKNIIIGGHQRCKVAKSIGIKSVPCLELDLTYDQERELNVRLNKNTGDWDFDALANNFDVEDLFEWGFDENDLNIDLVEEEKESLIDDDHIPENVEPVCKPGDLWQLGNHRLHCGDATSIGAINLLMNNKKADLYLTDPPYNVDYEGVGADKKKIKNDKQTNENFLEFLTDSFTNSSEHIKPGGSFYIWHSDLNGIYFRQSLLETDLDLRQNLIWVKSSLVIGRSDYQWIHEPCLYGWKAGGTHSWNNDRKQTTVLEYDKPTKNKLHPTMKPLEMIKYQITNSTKKNNIVLDNFLGSGTTLIACEKSNRVCYGMELDPYFCDVIINRWEQYTGQTAKKIK